MILMMLCKNPLFLVGNVGQIFQMNKSVHSEHMLHDRTEHVYMQFFCEFKIFPLIGRLWAKEWFLGINRSKIVLFGQDMPDYMYYGILHRIRFANLQVHAKTVYLLQIWKELAWCIVYVNSETVIMNPGLQRLVTRSCLNWLQPDSRPLKCSWKTDDNHGDHGHNQTGRRLYSWVEIWSWRQWQLS